MSLPLLMKQKIRLYVLSVMVALAGMVQAVAQINAEQIVKVG